MTTELALVVLAGALAGAAVAVIAAALRPGRPVLADALAALDERHTPHQPRTERGPARQVLLTVLRRLPVTAPDADLDLLGITRDRFLITAATRAGLLAATGPALLAVLAHLDAPIPVVVPTGFTLAGLIAGWTSHTRHIQDRADHARDQLRSALVAYLQQASLLRHGGAGITTALTIPATVLTDSWAMRRLRDELELSERAGEMPWEGLQRFGEQIGVNELADLSAIAAAAGQDGATVVDTLLARAESLTTELLADEHADARRASGQMSTPGALQVLLIAAWVLYPAGTALLTSI